MLQCSNSRTFAAFLTAFGPMTTHCRKLFLPGRRLPEFVCNVVNVNPLYPPRILAVVICVLCRNCCGLCVAVSPKLNLRSSASKQSLSAFYALIPLQSVKNPQALWFKCRVQHAWSLDSKRKVLGRCMLFLRHHHSIKNLVYFLYIG